MNFGQRWREARARQQLTQLSTPQQKESLARWAGLQVKELDAEIESREGFLNTLLSTGVSSIPEVNSAIEGFIRVETPR